LVRGTLQDSATAAALPDATVSVLKATDSTLLSFTATKQQRLFRNKKPGYGFLYFTGFLPGLIKRCAGRLL
jgi:hypothetical protein